MLDDQNLADALCLAVTIAVVGASHKPHRPSHYVMAYLLQAGYRVIPVNPGLAGTDLLGQPVYARLVDVPVPVGLVDIFRRREELGRTVDEALELLPLPGVIWMQLNLRDDQAAARAQSAGVTVIMNRCTMIDHQRLCGSRAGGVI